MNIFVVICNNSNRNNTWDYIEYNYICMGKSLGSIIVESSKMFHYYDGNVDLAHIIDQYHLH